MSSLNDRLLCHTLYITCNADGAWANGVIFAVTNDDLLILTNRHVADLLAETDFAAYAQAAGFPAAGGVQSFPSFPVQVFKTAATADLSVLRADIKELDAALLDFLKPVSYSVSAYENLQKGDVLNAFYIDRLDPAGFFYPEGSLGEAVLIDKSVPVDGFPESMMYLNYLSVKGMSGSGIYDQNGNLVGLLSAGDEKQGTTLAVPLPAGLSFLDFLP